MDYPIFKVVFSHPSLDVIDKMEKCVIRYFKITEATEDDIVNVKDGGAGRRTRSAMYYIYITIKKTTMKTIKLWLTTIAVLLCSITVDAATEFTVDGIEYTVVSTDGTCRVSGYNESFGTKVVIPSSVDYRNRTFSVISIGFSAFSGCSSLTTITIPEGVTSIGSSAFQECSSLTSITIPKSVTSIESQAFYKCKSLTSINIPEGVTSIGEKAFSGCRSLTSITIPKSVTSISNEAFAYCI